MKKIFIFLFTNVLLASLIAIKYFLVPGASFNLISIIFICLALPCQAFIFYLILSFICTLLFINIKWVPRFLQNIGLAIIFGSSLILIYIDTVTFEQYRFHINQSVLSLVLSGQVVDFSMATYLLMIVLVISVFLIEFILLCLIDKYLKIRKNQIKGLKYPFIFIILSLLISNIGYMIAAYYAYSPVVIVREYIPQYYPLTSKKIMGIFDKDGLQKNIRTKINFESNVKYPKQPLTISKNDNPTNIIFIVLDSWRYDTFNEDNTPNTYEFVKQHNGIIFDNHYSTGNATRTGIFGLFYGIPGTYWQSFFNNSIPSLFVTTLQKENYNIGIFSSAKISAPEFDRTAFVTIENLRINSEGKSSAERDKNLTKDWLEWFKKRDVTRPTFSFLFYDQPHAYEFLDNLELKYQPVSDINYLSLNNNTDPTPIFNRYKMSVYSVDYLLKQVYAELEQSGTLNNTLIIITGDHSQEMNDNRMGFWGHNGNYTDAQTKVPFIFIGAKGDNEKQLADNANRNVLTSHEDIVPTLMKHYLSVSNDTHDYSTGYDLIQPINDRHWLLMSNYSTYAVKTPTNIYMVNSIGMGQYMDEHNKLVSETPNYQYIHQALNNMKYFYEH